jgi:Ca2+-binding RTX toxin-like protein
VALSNGTVIGLRGLLSGVEAITAGVFTGVSISGSADPDTLNLSGVNLTGIGFIDSGAGNDTVTGNGAANVIRGGADNDTIVGNGGVDTITGGSGNDAINAGTGNDFIILAPGDGADTVTGFDSGPPGGQDRLNISAFGVTAGTFNANVSIAASGANTLVTVGGVTILLIGIVPASITAADFLLA